MNLAIGCRALLAALEESKLKVKLRCGRKLTAEKRLRPAPRQLLAVGSEL
jgi:hypothetical protein